MEIERANDLFISAPRPLLGTAMADDLAQSLLDSGMGLRTLIHMDDPQHRVVRAIGADWFRPKAMRALKVRVDELAKIHLDKMRRPAARPAGNAISCGKSQRITRSTSSWRCWACRNRTSDGCCASPRNSLAAPSQPDTEFRRGSTPEEQPNVLLEFFSYFNELTTARRAHPTDDLASAIANARVDGEPLSDIDTAS
jgi:cytochrome P450